MKNPALLIAIVLGIPGLVPLKATNTMVRFTYYHGTVKIGNMDVELFDQDKPVTVSNFLKYVRSGAYDNLMLHRAVPGFVIQAGSIRSFDPLTPAPPYLQQATSQDYLSYFISRLDGAPSFGSITNEVDVGPRYSNTVGMLAMARAIPGGSGTNLTHEERVAATNSASSDWFINLTNNAYLDTNWGGFTVFGRVVEGTNLLGFFDQTNANYSVVDMNFLWFGGQVPILNEVPISYPATYPFPHFPPYPPVPKRPAFNQIYHVRIAEFPATDSKRPTLAIKTPAAGALLTHPLPPITGTATDDVGIGSLWYGIYQPAAQAYFQDYTNVPISGTEWSLPIDLPAGSSVVLVQSVDASGLRSPLLTRRFFVTVPTPLSLTNVGNGTVTGATNQQLFVIERPVRLTAKPAPGHLFAGYTGTIVYEPTTIQFPMRTNESLTATFVPNPFPQLKGTYAGLFYNTNASIQHVGQIQPSGGIVLTVTELGGASGRLTVAGRTLPFSGKISPYGAANESGLYRLVVPAGPVAGLFNASPTWYVVFKLDVTNQSDQVRGGYVWDGNTFASTLALERVRPGTLASPSPFAGKYTIAISPGTNALQPRGWGIASATVNAAGTLTLAGTLADGAPFTQSTPVITTNGYWPFYASPYGAKGWMFGWLKVEPGQPEGDVSGRIVWRKVGPQAGKPYANGFEFYPTVTGSRYTPATLTQRVLDFSEGILSLTGPNVVPVTNQIALATNNIVTNLDTNKLTYVLTKPSGLFTGTVRPVGENRILTYKGAVLQSQGYGVGYYLSTNLSGSVYFGP